MEGEPTDQELYDRSFIEEPAILDKHKAAAVITDGKLRHTFGFEPLVTGINTVVRKLCFQVKFN